MSDVGSLGLRQRYETYLRHMRAVTGFDPKRPAKGRRNLSLQTTEADNQAAVRNALMQ